MARPPLDAADSAALAICESLLLSLFDIDALREPVISGIQQTAAAAHARHPGADATELHQAVAGLIDGMIPRQDNAPRD